MNRVRDWLRSYSAAVVAVGTVSPVVAGVSTIVAMFNPLPMPVFAGSTVVYGFALGVVVWLIASVLSVPLASPASANRGSYTELLSRVQPIRLRIERWRAEADQNVASRPREALDEAESQLGRLDTMLTRPGLAWIEGDGYISAWSLAHRSEEALIFAETRDEVRVEIEHDRLRLDGAAMSQRAQLSKLLDEADRRLDGFGLRPDRLTRARAKSREVRNAINAFRDGGFGGLVRLRNQTYVLLLLTSFNVYALLALAIVGGAQRTTILAAAGFYLIGAVVGLFSRLYQQMTAAATVEDYGLATARLFTIPIYSGLAGLAGVLLYGLTATFTSSGASARTLPSLDQVLSVVSNPFGVLLAAAFGAAPDFVLKGLSQVADKYKSEIVSTQASGRVAT